MECERACDEHGKLQRGRARAGAEWRSAPSPISHWHGFNGAAPARARNVRCQYFNGRPRGHGQYASTGPRPRGRGMRSVAALPNHRRSFNGAAPARARNAAQHPPAAPVPVMLRFNGAAPARARNGRRTQLTPAAGAMTRMRSASTGPRPRGRGMRLTRGYWRAGRVQASTGPRPRGRGMPVDGCAPRQLAAASTGPRPRGRGMMLRAKADDPQLMVLQRGRARAGAECEAASIGRISRSLALQRGRARAGAECAPSHARRCMPHRFNGAAPARARNATPSSRRMRHLRFNGAAPARARNVSKCASAASTGPRSRGRGMLRWAACTLQRGRARAGAEWPTVSTGQPWRTLQRGRARAGAE